MTLESKEIGDTYTCANCGGTFTKGRSDAEAIKEYREKYGDRDYGPLARICDHCNDRIATWWNSLTPAERQRMNEEAERAARKQ